VTAIVTAEPVRGGFPDPAVIGLPGWQQIALYGTALLPRSPLSRLLGLDLASVEPGRASYRLPLSPWLCDGEGRVSPAVVAVAADAALAGGVVSGLSPGHARIATVDLSVHHLGVDLDRLLEDGEGLLATGRPCGPAGPGLVLAELEVTAESGRPVARGLGHCLVFPPLDPVPPAPETPAAAESATDWATPDPYERPLDDEARAVGPLTRLLGLAAVSAEPGGAEPGAAGSGAAGSGAAGSGEYACTMPASQWLCPTAPAIQGGTLVMLGQLAAERAVADLLGRRAAITQVTASFVRMVFPRDALLTARATASRHSRNLATAAVELTDETGRALVEVAATCYDTAP
jgi:acyl-coenzyme A thioesterase PaaI-like protein